MVKTTGRFFVGGLLALFSSVVAQADPYTLGDGWKLGGTPYYVGGYFSTYYWHDPQGNSGFGLDDAAVMLYGVSLLYGYFDTLNIAQIAAGSRDPAEVLSLRRSFLRGVFPDT